ncbi:hypothetical protein GFK97_01975 [Pseudomonas stutzeri]|nr:hypothetical protein [Stutzerimonas stutzeri]
MLRREPRCLGKWRRARRGTQVMVFPCQVPQRRMAPFAAQPEGPGLFLRGAALFVAHLERPNFSPHALPRARTGAGAAANETSTDPIDPVVRPVRPSVVRRRSAPAAPVARSRPPGRL